MAGARRAVGSENNGRLRPTKPWPKIAQGDGSAIPLLQHDGPMIAGARPQHYWVRKQS